ncbi:MAG: IS4 family transposase [Rikenellaceae bacterium]
MFKDHTITAKETISYIPDDMIKNLAGETKVDHYAKVLKGRNMFYLLLYGILENERLSQRSLEDTFNDPIFKTLFNLDKDEKVRRSSISERLSNIEANYFRAIYESIYKQFSQLYSHKESERYNIMRVDSSIVTDVSGRLIEGLKPTSNSNAKSKPKTNIKYTMSFDGLLPSSANVFTNPSYSSEDLALPEAIKNHVASPAYHDNIYIIDRGLQSTAKMIDLDTDDIKFVGRLKESRKYKVVESIVDEPQAEAIFDGLKLILDSKAIINSGTSEKKELEVRIVIVERVSDNQRFVFVSNDYSLSYKEVAAFYKKRWDIEVFFRFIKQELNASHLISLNKNGIEVMLYMTLITAMLILIYKKMNSIGYKTAKRRFAMEIRNLAIEIIIIASGGDPKLFFKN